MILRYKSFDLKLLRLLIKINSYQFIKMFLNKNI